MIAFINSEFDQTFKLAVYSHKDGYLVQLIENLECVEEIILSTAEKVSKFAEIHGIILGAMTIKNYEFSGKVYLENQAIGFNEADEKYL